MKLVTILSNANGQLVAEQRPQSVGFLLVIGTLLMLALAFYFVRSRAWTMLVLPGLGLLILFGLSLIGQKTTFRIQVDESGHQIVSQELKGDKVISTVTTPSSDIASAEMQSNRGARKIVLIHRDGHQSFPLGEQELQDEPDQYVILNALRAAIGQNSLPPQ